MSKFSLYSLRSRAIVLVLLAIFPLLALTLYSYVDQRDRAIREVQRDEIVTARNLATILENLIRNTRQVLVGMAQLPEVHRREGNACNALFASLLEQSPHCSVIAAVDPDGRVFASAPAAPGPVNVADRLWFQKPIQTGAFCVDEPVLDRISGKYNLNLSYPILDATGRLKGVIVAGLDLQWLGSLLARSDLPSSTALVLTDATWKVLFRYPEPLKYLGRMLPDILIKAMTSRDEGVAAGVGLPGDERLFAFAQLSPPWQEMRVAIGLPRDWAVSKVNRDLWRNLIWLGLVAILALTAAWFGAGLFVVQPVRKLRGVTERLAAGDLTVRAGPQYTVGEMGLLAHAFDQMADSLQEREADLHRAKDELEQRVQGRTAELRQTVEQLQREVEERLRTAEDLKESEERYRLLAENVTDLIWTTDMNIELTFVSPSMKLLLGFTPEEAIELGTKKLLTPASYELAENTLHEEIALGSQEPVDLTRSRAIEIELIHKEGFTVWAEVNFTFLRDQDGHPVGLVGVTRDITERKRAREVLKESEQKLRNLTGQLLTAQEEERKRLSRELHDSLGQTLLVLKLQMRAIEKRLRPDQQTLWQEGDQTLRQIDRIIEDVRRLARNLSPSVLDDFGLAVALRNLCEEFHRYQNLKLSLDMDDISGSFSPEAQSHIYRFFQESLTNIGKYAQASRVSLAIKRRDGGVAFVIEDDGIGFQLEEVQARDGVERAMGLETMAERVRILGGELQISSKPGAGTRISFIIPEGPQI